MQNVIPLRRPSIWPRVVIGAAVLAVLGLCANVAFACEGSADPAQAGVHRM